MTHWLMLIVALPTHPSSVRVRAWRKLRALGAAALKNSVYLLPVQPGAARTPAVAHAGGPEGPRRGDPVPGRSDREHVRGGDRGALPGRAQRGLQGAGRAVPEEPARAGPAGPRERRRARGRRGGPARPRGRSGARDRLLRGDRLRGGRAAAGDCGDAPAPGAAARGRGRSAARAERAPLGDAASAAHRSPGVGLADQAIHRPATPGSCSRPRTSSRPTRCPST